MPPSQASDDRISANICNHLQRAELSISLCYSGSYQPIPDGLAYEKSWVCAYVPDSKVHIKNLWRQMRMHQPTDRDKTGSHKNVNASALPLFLWIWSYHCKVKIFWKKYLEHSIFFARFVTVSNRFVRKTHNSGIPIWVSIFRVYNTVFLNWCVVTQK